MADDRWSRRKVLRGLGGAAALGGLTAAGAVAAESDRPAITVWTWQTTTESDALAAAADTFNASQDGVEVIVVQRPSIYSTQQLASALQAGEGPDICVFGRSVLPERAALGLVEDLSPFLASSGSRLDLDRDFHPFAVDEVRGDGRVNGIPLDLEVRVLLYNRTLLADEGVLGPEWEPSAGAVTFSHLAEVSERLERRDASGFFERAGFVPFLGEGTPYVYLHAWHGRYFDASRCAFTIDSPEVVQAVSWVRDFCERADPVRLLEVIRRNDGQPSSAGLELAQEHVAIVLARDWELARVENLNPGFEIGATVVPTPDMSQASVSWATGHAACMVSGTQYPDEAYRFIEYLGDVEAQSAYCLQVDRLPCRLDTPENVLQALDRPSFVNNIVVPGAASSPPVPVATEFHTYLTASWSDMIMGHVSVESGLGELELLASGALDAAGACG